MEVPLPFGIAKGKLAKMTGWRIVLVSLLFLILLTLVVVLVWGDTLAFPKTLEKDVPTPIFNVSADLAPSLEIGSISDDLRRGFRSGGDGLSDNATVSTVEEGRRWLIIDPGKKYAVIKERNKLSINGGVLSASLQFQEDLETGTISEGLREGFRSNQIGLSDNATASTLEEGNAWLITDPSKKYAVTKEENDLKIDEVSERKVFLDKDIASGVDRATRYVTAEGAFVFDRISDVIKKVLTWVEDALVWLPWPALIAAVALLAWRMAGLSVMLFSTIGLLLIGFVGLWPSAMETLSLMLTSVLISTAIAIPIGITAARSNAMDAAIRPILDGMQTMPSFVYLVPAIFFFGLGNVPAVVATVIYAVPPAIRLTNLGIRQVSAETVEAARAFGATPLQLLLKVQIPLALPTIMAGINQTTMMALAMVVVASLVGAGGLGADVLKAIGRLQIGNSLLAGLSIVILAIIIDRMTQGFAKAQARATQE